MLSLYGNCNGAGGVIDNQLYITTQKVGSTALHAVSPPEFNFYFDQDNVIELIEEYTSKAGAKKEVCLILRDPEERLYTGAVQNSFVIYAAGRGNLGTFLFERDIVFTNSKKLSSFRNFAAIHANDWIYKGIPIEHEHVIRTLLEVYFTKTINKEVYYEPHVMPFYTSIYKLFVQNKIKFFCNYLQDVNFKTNPNNLRGVRHSNSVFRNIVREVYKSTDNEFLKGIIKMERQTIHKLTTFYTKPSPLLL